MCSLTSRPSSSFHKLTYGEGWMMDVTTSLADYPYEKLKDYSIIISLNAMPGGSKQREAFEKYMENGGGWMGFHASAYNDRNTHWPWLNRFLGCGQFYCNNWPPQPALLECDTQDHPVTRTLPASFVAPSSEFYQWDPSPRKNPDVEVLVSISQKMYPFGLKDVVKWGDFPIVWTNKRYRMVYLNMGHGDEGFIDATQNLLFVNAFRWVVSRDPKGDPFKARVFSSDIPAMLGFEVPVLTMRTRYGCFADNHRHGEEFLVACIGFVQW